MYPAVPVVTSLILALSAAGCIELDATEATTEANASAVSAATCTTSATGTWCTETAPIPTTVMLRGAWAISASDVFAIGDGGTIIRRTNGAWAAMTSGTTTTLNAVWASSSSNVWAVGAGGAILRFNGTAWSALTGISGQPTTNLTAVWGSGPNDVWVCGASSVWHWNGTAFTMNAIGGSLMSLSGTGPSDAWVVGDSVLPRHFDGTSWVPRSPLAGATTFFAVLSISPTEVWITDNVSGKEALHLTGGTWVVTKPGVAFNGLSAISSTSVWGIAGNKVGRWSGTAWTVSMPLTNTDSFHGVAAATGNVWVVGNNARIGHQAL
jgi:hypothetical protein